MKCQNCGTEFTNDNNICPNCAERVKEKNDTYKVSFLPSFILGLIGSLFGISGGLCMTMCSSFYSSGTEAFILIFGGSIVGLIGACKCLSNAKKGSILELIGAIMIAICAYGITGADFQTIVAFLLFLIGGSIGLLYSFSKSR